MSSETTWIEATWPAPAGVIAGCTTRAGGVSRNTYASLNLGSHVDDEPAAVEENRRRFRALCGLVAEPEWLTQVHGTKVVIEPHGGNLPTADAALGRHADAACAVLIADCLPVLVCSRDGQEIAAAHAGWRGLAAGVIEATVAAFRSPPGQLMCWLGPAISQPNFEVGDEVRAAFLDKDAGSGRCFRANQAGRWQADLYGLARRRLVACGLQQIHGEPMCTYANPQQFFSFRRDGQTGRMAAFVAKCP